MGCAMFGLVRAAARRPVGVALGNRLLAPRVRTAVGIKILDEKQKAAEAMYWHAEDEKLLKKLIENNPELNPEYQGIAGVLSDDGSVESKVKLIFMKHGIPPMNKALIADIVALVEKM